MSEEIRREIHIDAPPDVVFAYFVDPDKMTRWKGLTATLDPRPGGTYRVDVYGTVARGEYVSVDPPHRVVFTWGWEGDGQAVPPGTSTVEVTLEAEGNGTILRLRHFDLPAGEGPAHQEGWDHFLPRLAETAGGKDPGPDPWAQ